MSFLKIYLEVLENSVEEYYMPLSLIHFFLLRNRLQMTSLLWFCECRRADRACLSVVCDWAGFSLELGLKSFPSDYCLSAFLSVHQPTYLSSMYPSYHSFVPLTPDALFVLWHWVLSLGFGRGRTRSGSCPATPGEVLF